MRLHTQSSSQRICSCLPVSPSPRLPIAARRRGVVLLVVLVLLAMFAIVGITFVYLADAEATKAKYAVDAEIKHRPDPDLVFAFALNQVMFDSSRGDSAMQTHGLSSSAYGISGNVPFTGIGRGHGTAGDPLTTATGMDKHDLINFGYRPGYSESIHGPLSLPYTYPSHTQAWLAAVDGNGTVLTRSVSHRNKRRLNPLDPLDFAVQEPIIKFYSARSFTRPVKLPIIQMGGPHGPDDGYIWFDPYDPVNSWFWARETYWVGPNTYIPQPPLNVAPPGIITRFQTYLANYLIATPPPGFPTPVYQPGFLAALADPVARKAILRAMVCRPGPWDHANFASIDDAGGDLKNQPAGSSVGGVWFGNDSIWMDLGFPVQMGADGRRYKPLFAFTTIDLDNRINLNAGGNIWGTFGGTPGFSTSNHGFGPWEINPFRLLNYGPPGNPGAGPAEGIQIYQGTTSTPVVQGKYGSSVVGGAVATPPSLHFTLWPRRVPYFSRFDPDGARELLGYSPSDPYRLPGYDASANDTWNYDRFPRHAVPAYPPPPALSIPLGYGSGVSNMGNDENRKLGPVPHMLSHTYFAPQGPNAVFPVSTMDALLRHGDTGADSLTSDFRRLLMNNMAAHAPDAVMYPMGRPRLRRQVTAHSADLERVGAIPYWHGDQSGYIIPGDTGAPLPPPGMILDRPPAGGPPTAGAPPRPSSLPAAPPDGEFAATYRSLAAVLGRIDLNRPLADYPLPDTSNVVPITPPLAMGPPNLEIGARIGDREAFRHAQAARQDLAADIYRRLLAVTGAEQGLGTMAPPLPATKVNTLRYLAQLAVNIVDFRDLDDYNTPFNWGGYLMAVYTNLAGDPSLVGAAPRWSNWVYGTELPRLLVNEAYAQYADPGMGANATINVWLELYNPMHRDTEHEFERDERFQPAYGYPAYSQFMPGNGQRLYMPNSAPGVIPSDAYAIYRVILANDATGAELRALNNSAGDVPMPNRRDRPGGAGAKCVVDNWAAPVSPAVLPPPEDWNPTTLPNSDYVHPSNDNVSGARRVTVMMTPTVRFTTAPDKGFYLLGPMDAFPQGMSPSPPPPTATLQRPEMSYEVPAADAATRTTIVLQRLACPHLPHDNSPTLPLPFPPGTPNPFYNPYVTVDYMEGLEPELDAAVNLIDTRQSLGRRQPYATRLSRDMAGAPLPDASQALLKLQTPDPDPPSGTRTGQPRHTFLRINCAEEVNYSPSVDRDPLIIDYNDDGVPEAPDRSNRTSMVALPAQTLVGSARNSPPPPTPPRNTLPIDWLKHLDRDLVSPLELLHVSGYKPHELTQQFMVDRTTDGVIGGLGATPTAHETFQHVVDWFDKRTDPLATNRLYRIFDYLQVRSRIAGTSQITMVPTAIVQPDPVNAPGYCTVQVLPGTGWYRPNCAPAVNGGLWEVVPGTCVALNGGPVVRVVGSRPGPLATQLPTPVGPDTFTVYLPAGLRPPAYSLSTLTMTYLNGRIPGKVNLNTVTDIEVFRALCDASPANTFNPTLPLPVPGAATVLPVDSMTLVIPGGPVTYNAMTGRLSGSSHGVSWTIGVGAEELLEINDPIGGRETVRIFGPIVDASGMGAGPFTIPIRGLDYNLRMIPATGPPFRGTTLNHTRSPSNPFQITVDRVSTMFVKLTASRDGNATTPAHPFVGFSAGGTLPGDPQYSAGFGILDTWFRQDPTSSGSPQPRLLENTTGVHPQRWHELLNKLGNNVTARSNVFGVWMTVGYFEMESEDRDADGMLDPGEDTNGNAQIDHVYLGREIGRADGRHVRHRMFAIIDRTNLDPYVQQMNALIQADTINPLTGQPDYEYDVSLGARPTRTTPPPLIQPSTPISQILPIVGGGSLDPRRPYRVDLIVQPRVTVPPLPPIVYTIQLPPTVLYWSLIE